MHAAGIGWLMGWAGCLSRQQPQQQDCQCLSEQPAVAPAVLTLQAEGKIWLLSPKIWCPGEHGRVSADAQPERA